MCACTCARLFWQRLFVLCFVMGYMLQFWETALKEYSVINNATVQESLTNTSELITAERPLVPDLLFWNYKKRRRKKRAHTHTHTHTHTRTNSKHWFTTSFEEEGAVKRCSECDTHTHTPLPNSAWNFRSAFLENNKPEVYQPGLDTWRLALSDDARITYWRK